MNEQRSLFPRCVHDTQIVMEYVYLFLKLRENSRFTTNTTIKMDKKTCVGLGLIKKKDDQELWQKIKRVNNIFLFFQIREFDYLFYLWQNIKCNKFVCT